MKCRALCNALIAVGALSFGGASHAADWFPVKVKSVAADGKESIVDYRPVAKAAQPWKICAAYPHLKDSFWLGADYGMVEEAKRLGVKLQVMDAGGYEHLANQISQIENCVAGGANAVLVGAVSYDGLNNALEQVRKKNIVVIDVMNGVSFKDVSARTLASPYGEGYNAGQYLAKRHPAGTAPVKVAWFPGPAGAGFVELFNKGFLAGVKGGAIDIVETKYGDIGKEVQARLIEDALQVHKKLDYIVGTAVTAEAGVPVLRAHGRKDVKLVSLYLTPGVYQGIKAKAIEASGVEAVVTIGRIAVDQAVRALEKKEVISPATPVVGFYDQSNIKTLDAGISMAPRGFKPVFKVE